MGDSFSRLIDSWALFRLSDDNEIESYFVLSKADDAVHFAVVEGADGHGVQFQCYRLKMDVLRRMT
jgi:hypothetical protein